MSLSWNLCIICQKATCEELRCPSRSHGATLDVKSIYSLFLQNASDFSDIDALPTNLSLPQDIDVDVLVKKEASWHKSCHLQFSTSKLNKAKHRSTRLRKREQEEEEKSEEVRPSKTRRSSHKKEHCILCGEGEGEQLHEVTMLATNDKLRNMITDLQDETLLPRISGVDLIAAEAKYHLKCLTDLRNRHRKHITKKRQESFGQEEKIKESQAYVELVEHIKKSVADDKLIFRLSELHSLYLDRLKTLGVNKEINKTRLKVSLLETFPEAQEQSDGKSVIIVFKRAIQRLIKDGVLERDYSEDASILAKASSIIRKDIFGHDKFKFTGQFSEDCQESSVPASLKSLVSMLLYGVNIENADAQESQPCLTVCQTILFNTKAESSKKSKTGQTRHSNAREPPLPLYIGITVHAMTRSKSLITKLYQLGMSVSYQRIVELEDMIAGSVSERFIDEGIVAPACLRKGVFTVGALDNLDHNPSSTTAASSFHGTGISMFQLATTTNPGEKRPPITIPPQGTGHSLLEEYAVVPPVELDTSKIVVPESRMQEPANVILEEKKKEKDWSEHSIAKLDEESIAPGDAVTWTAYHAANLQSEDHLLASTALLPLFYEKAATPAMVKHGMSVLEKAITFLNPDQVPVITVDQPLFAIAKMVQWRWPASHGEKSYVVMMGGLHIEMTLWSTIGDLLYRSGWTAALTEAEVASSGVADSFLKASHLKRTRHAHQVTILALYKLKMEAFSQCKEKPTLLEWEKARKSSPTFFFWDLILRYEMLVLLVVRAHRQRNFDLYVEALEELVPFFFALDHINYARWTPIHIRDMKSLPDTIAKKFREEGDWVLSESGNEFSAIPFDQAHEQENKVVKSSGGAVGLTENPTAFRRWMLSGPEMARLLHQFEDQYLTDSDNDSIYQANHEKGLTFQKTFKKQVNNLVDVIRRMGNPFLDNFPELVTLDNRDCMDDSVAAAIFNLEALGKNQYLDFMKAVIQDRTTVINNPLKKNNLPLFGKSTSREKSKQTKKIATLQNNVSLFAQLYIAMQSRDANLEEFFSHEVQSYPPSLSEFGNLRLPSAKSDLLKCIQCQQPDPPSEFDCKVCDGAVIVHCLPVTGAVSTFDNYADNVFLPYIQNQSSRRIDIVWDSYVSDSLKQSTREKRGKGIRRKVSGGAKIPTKWLQFLRDSANKEELFTFLTAKAAEHPWPEAKEIYVTAGVNVIAIGTERPMTVCSHEEADTRIVVHVHHAIQAEQVKTVLIRTVDTDVVVVLVGKFYFLKESKPDLDLWVAFGMGRNFKFISINAIYSRLGEARSRSLPVFHALSGCDTTSSFFGKSKISAWKAWELYPDVTQTFQFLAENPFYHLTLSSDHFTRIERFAVILYDKLSQYGCINKVRMELFCKNNCTMDRLPPTKDALLQHVNRSIYQAGIWTTSQDSQQVLPSPEHFSWKKEDGVWVPKWITILEVSKACSELIKCCCKGSCNRCKCAKAKLTCTPLCKCKCNVNV